MNEGWVCLHRKLVDWEWFTDVNTCHLFLYCLLRANHEDTKWRGISIERGQFITSLDSLSKGAGLTVKQVRTALKKLESTGEVASKTTNKNRVITVVNYNKHQDKGKQEDRQEANKGQAEGKQRATDNNENNNNNKNNKGNLPIPSWMPKQDWEDYLEMRNKKKKPATDRAKQLVILKIDGLRKKGHCPAKLLQESIINGWVSVFEGKNTKEEVRTNTNRVDGKSMILEALNGTT